MYRDRAADATGTLVARGLKGIEGRALRAAALVLVDLQGYSIDDAARILGCAPGTVKSRCSRGRARLAVLLQHLKEVN